MTMPAVAPDRALALAPTAAGQIGSANEMEAALKAVQAAIAPDLNAHELRLFAMVAFRSGLDPFARQIHAVKRQGKVTFQTGIDGFRSSAERTGEYDGSDEPEFGPPCSCSEQPKPHPEWAKVTVYRLKDGERKGQSATAYWHEFKPAPGSSGNGDAMWKKMPRNQLAKCAEALAFRKRFPYVLANVYTDDEMAQADTGPRVIEHRPTAREAVAQRAAEVNGSGGEEIEGSAVVVDEAEPAQDGPGAADPGNPPTDTTEEGVAAAGPDAGDEAQVLEEGLTQREFIARCQAIGVSGAQAVAAAKERWPDFDPPNNALTPQRRVELIEALEAQRVDDDLAGL